MDGTEYGFDAFVDDLRTAAGSKADDRAAIRAVIPLVKRMAENEHIWLKPEHYTCDEEQGFGVHLLHEEPDHSLAVFAFSWLPGRGAPPHDHGTWAVVAGVDGLERNVNWRRNDDRAIPDHCDIEVANQIVVEKAQVLSFMPDDIHSVHNDTEAVTVSFHVYGRNVNYTGRSKFDPNTGEVEKFVVAIE